MIVANGLEFPSLREVHRHARAVGWADVTVEAEGVITGPGVSWTYDVPLTVRGGVWQGTDQTSPPWASGWWLSYRVPRLLTLEGVTVRRYALGGVDLGGSFSNARSAMVVRGSRFSFLGSPSPGYAALFAERSDVQVVGCVFRDLINPPPSGSLMHAVYLAHSSVGTVEQCQFRAVTGDPVRVRDGSAVEVSACRSVRAGFRAMVSAWRVAGEEASSVMREWDNDPGLTWDGMPAQVTRVVV